MPLVWRLTPPEFHTELDGEGARLFGGRWNSPGLRALYTSSHLSLSVLETYVNIPAAARNSLPVFQAVNISIPDDASTMRVSPAQLAELLMMSDPVEASRLIGDDWIKRCDSLVLRAPSVLVPEEDNLIVNPDNADASNIRIVSTRAFHFDPRLVMPRAYALPQPVPLPLLLRDRLADLVAEGEHLHVVGRGPAGERELVPLSLAFERAAAATHGRVRDLRIGE